MTPLVVDTSVWVDFFRGDLAAMKKVNPLLSDARATLTGAVYAEVLSGTQQRSDFNRLKLLLGSLQPLPAPDSLWDQVAEARFNLARQGIQAHLVDLTIALTALHHGHALLTRDRDFLTIARVVPLDVDVF